MKLSVRRNHDYTISIIDSKSREISFRDIRGSDLEYLDSVLGSEGGEGKKEVSFDDVLTILSLLCTRKVDFGSFPQRISVGIFKHLSENILCNYMSKSSWLRRCYSMQNGSFVGLRAMEQIPMSKFVVMAQIHNEAIDAINNQQG